MTGPRFVAYARVLRTASPGRQFPADEGIEAVDAFLCSELGVKPVPGDSCFMSCECWMDRDRMDYLGSDHATPGLVEVGEYDGDLARCIHAQRRDYAPEVVSPHLFGAVQ